MLRKDGSGEDLQDNGSVYVWDWLVCAEYEMASQKINKLGYFLERFSSIQFKELHLSWDNS